MRLAAVVLLLTILATPTVAVRLTLRRARRAEWLDDIDRAGLRRISPVPPAPPTTYRPSGCPLNSNAAPPAER